MTAIWILAAALALTGLMDLWVRLVYHYPRRPHTAPPAALGLPFAPVRFPTPNDLHLYE